jgi:DNA-binding transcriptional LysR family regulator
MDVRQLEHFLAVVDHGGFNRAASALYVSQPSLSQAVRALERDLGSDVFHRIGRRVVLTEAGRALIEPAREAVRSLQLARASVESVQGLHSGWVDIAATPSQAIEPCLHSPGRDGDGPHRCVRAGAACLACRRDERGRAQLSAG